MGMGKLSGKHVAVTGPRCEEEFNRIVGKLDGTPWIYPAQGTVYSNGDQLMYQILELLWRPVDWLVLTTGIGTEALLSMATTLGMGEELLAVMKKSRIAARGYKTVNALRKLGIHPEIKADDGTMDSVYKAIAEHGLSGKRIALQLYGDPSPRISGKLRMAGAECIELMPYVHVMPDVGPIDELIGRCIDGSLDAVVFTSTVQARSVFQRARVTGKEQPLLEAFDSHVLGIAVGKITAEAMNDEGMERVVYPEEERLGPAILCAASRMLLDHPA